MKSHRLEMSSPLVTPIGNLVRSVLETELLMAENAAEAAIRVGESAPPINWSTMFFPLVFMSHGPIDRDALARAYLKKGDVDRAILKYERLITFDPGSRDRMLIRPIFHYRLAKLYEQKARTKEALAHYQKFLTIMSEADIYLTEIADAKARVAKLANSQKM